MSIQTLIEHGPFIAGTAEPLSGEQREITNPGTGELVGRVTEATAQDADRAVQAARAAFGEWARLGYADRGKVIHACAEAFEAHVDELTPILVAEQGKTIREAKIELHKAADTLEHYAGLSRQVRGISVHNLDTGVDARVLRRPLGVVAAIVPWNFPTTLLCNKLGPAFLAGNTVVAKPADIDAVHDAAPGRDLQGGRAARRRLQRASRARAPWSARRSSRTRSCARSPSPARRRSASACTRWPRPAPSA